MEIKLVSAPETHELRNRVLRPGRPVEVVDYPQDRLPSAFHLGAFIDGEHAGTASFYNLPNELALAAAENPPAEELWQLRGMGSAPEYKGRGIGTAMLERAYPELTARGGTVLWCNARVVALEFYRKMGFLVLGDEFMVPDIGPHYVMWRRVPATRTE